MVHLPLGNNSPNTLTFSDPKKAPPKKILERGLRKGQVTTG